jgi:xanthine dehydrogenase YagS FAD-binding subunit
VSTAGHRVSLVRELGELAGKGELIAGGTDVCERIRSGRSPGPFTDVTPVPGLGSIAVGEGGATIGALATIMDVGARREVAQRYPALAQVCRTIATPQIRARATVGGVLCQRTRCWYYRHAAFSCFKSGGKDCPARQGDNSYGIAFDLGPCAFPHPSSVALALIAYGAVVDTTTREELPVEGMFGDGRDPTRDHILAEGEMLVRARIPPSTPGETAAYFRLMARAWAEWPLVECAARLRVGEGGRIELARVCLGAVANIPLRMPHVEEHLTGREPSEETLAEAAALARQGAVVTPGGQDKRPLIVGTVLETLERALTRTT